VWCPDWFPGTSLGSSLGLLPRHLPRHLPRRCLGRCLGSCLEQVSQDPGKPAPDAPNPPIPPIPGNRGFGPRPRPRDRPRGLIPYSIYISQFQTGTPKPRYIGFRDGGRENGTQNGQFRPVFGHILRPLSGPSLFEQFRALERPRAWFPQNP
jgi:hypothetical protein